MTATLRSPSRALSPNLFWGRVPLKVGTLSLTSLLEDLDMDKG